MSDRIHSFTVVLEKDMPSEDAQAPEIEAAVVTGFRRGTEAAVAMLRALAARPEFAALPSAQALGLAASGLELGTEDMLALVREIG